MEYDNVGASAVGEPSAKQTKKRKSGKRCVAYGCSNDTCTTPKVSLHTFPDPEKDSARHVEWVNAVTRTRADWSGPPKSASAFRMCVLCSDHFEQDCFNPISELKLAAGYHRVTLKPDAVPTRFFVRLHDKVKSPRRVLQRGVIPVSAVTYANCSSSFLSNFVVLAHIKNMTVDVMSVRYLY